MGAWEAAYFTPQRVGCAGGLPHGLSLEGGGRVLLSYVLQAARVTDSKEELRRSAKQERNKQGWDRQGGRGRGSLERGFQGRSPHGHNAITAGPMRLQNQKPQGEVPCLALIVRVRLLPELLGAHGRAAKA